METITLYTLNNMVKGAISSTMSSRYWITCELSEVHETAVGHCYIEVVQRDEAAGGIVAKARGTIWSRTYSLLRPYFLEQTGQRFAAGLNVLIQVTVSFHEVYGYALDVCDIEPAFTVGDMVRRRQQIIKRLEDEGVLGLNKELPFPQLPQRVAVISSSRAAGYGDFCNQLAENPYGFVFYTHLYQAPMQGNKVEEGIIAALNSIAESDVEWDVVVIIRGGGATSDLSCFDTYDLANNCAQFPLPIVTGIGHQRDDTLLDLVAHTRVKTPTAAAELLIHTMAAAASRLDILSKGVADGVRDMIASSKNYIGALSRNIVDAVRDTLSQNEHRIHSVEQRLPIATMLYMQQQAHRLDLWQQQVEAASPKRILSLGYSLTTCNGRVVRSLSDISVGDSIVTHLADAELTSTITSTKKYEK